MARKMDDPAGYDALLRTASDAVLMAADAGTLTPMRSYRLIEILAVIRKRQRRYISKRCQADGDPLGGAAVGSGPACTSGRSSSRIVRVTE